MCNIVMGVHFPTAPFFIYKHQKWNCRQFTYTIESTTSAAPLVLQDINLVIVVTDLHSWVAGHKHNNTIDANYGKKEIIKLFNFETSNFKLYNTRARAQSFSAFSATWYETRGVMNNVRVAPQ